jgi:hypothetical protein
LTPPSYKSESEHDDSVVSRTSFYLPIARENDRNP